MWVCHHIYGGVQSLEARSACMTYPSPRFTIKLSVILAISTHDTPYPRSQRCHSLKFVSAAARQCEFLDAQSFDCHFETCCEIIILLIVDTISKYKPKHLHHKLFKCVIID